MSDIEVTDDIHMWLNEQVRVYEILKADNATLRAEIERLRAALALFACDCTVDERCAVPDNCRNFQARKHLESAHDRCAALVEKAIQHVKDVGPNSYEEWVGLIINFTCNACAKDPTLLRGEHKPETPSPAPASSAVPGAVGRP